MGAYFSLRTSKSLPLFDLAAVGVADPKATLRSGKLLASELASLCHGEQRALMACSFTRAVVDTYWSRIQVEHENPLPLPHIFAVQKSIELSDAASVLATTMGHAASALDPHAAAYLVSATYTAMLPDSARARLGAYYTPPPLADRLVSMATKAGVKWQTCRVLDPACGGGAFLAAVAQLLVATALGKSAREVILDLASRLRGFEIDSFAGWLSQVFLEATLMPLCHSAGQRLPVVVDIRDSLATRWSDDDSGQYDLVIGNPPYGRVSLEPKMRSRYSRSLYGHANLYGLFTDLAFRLTRAGGVVAYVTPTSFLAGEYFKSLRALLARSARLVNVDFLSVRRGVFDDALQETMLATYRKTAMNSDAPTVHFVAPTEDDELSVEYGGKFDLPRSGGPWLLPRSLDQARLIKKLRTMPHRLKDYGYEVSTGPLVWNRHKSQLASRPGKSVFPLIWAEAVTSAGRFQFRADRRNHAPYFRVRGGDDWLLVRRPCILLQRTTAKEQLRRLIAAELPNSLIRKHGAVVVENHLNMIRATAVSAAVSPGIVAEMLNTAIVDRAFRCISGSVAVSAYELEHLPLPNPADLKRLLKGAINRGTVGEVCRQLYSED